MDSNDADAASEFVARPAGFVTVESPTTTTTPTTTARPPTTTTTKPPPRLAAPLPRPTTTTTKAKPKPTTTTRPSTTTSTSSTTTTTIPSPGNTHHETGAASWYPAREGQCAHRTIAKGTPIQVTNVSTGATVRCKVATGGPSDTRRVVDLARDTFAKIGDPGRGIVEVRLDW